MWMTMQQGTSRLRFGVKILAVFVFGMCSTVAISQPYPTKPVRIVVGFPPGTGSDLVTRVVAQSLSERIKQSVYVDNRPGASGMIGAVAVATAEPDGYTLLVSTNAGLIITPLMAKNDSYHVKKSFSIVGGIVRTSMAMVTGTTPSSPASMADIISRAKAAKGASVDRNFSSPGVGTLSHLTGEVFIGDQILDMVHIPYKGSVLSLNDVARGEVLFGVDTPTAALPFIQSGRLRAVAVTGEKRHQSIPNTPTFIELGGPAGMRNLFAWWGLLAPAGTPVQIVQRLSVELVRILDDAEVIKRLQAMGLEPFPRTSEELVAFVDVELPFWERFLTQLGAASSDPGRKK